ncbi:hypothetical protein EGR_00408 [Echinococcus granulosus]|uniref:Uncharacterized protein n=1 Tax=Echinococcus granulosus TaxID=6210 RepID=W6VE77_ECHGR|nr:hypothetical protein EGR_00408 [Echinococcus granulosus]EUB65139.1 hypothetical protein EGR_00408 [Echinococcus granulosus]
MDAADCAIREIRRQEKVVRFHFCRLFVHQSSFSPFSIKCGLNHHGFIENSFDIKFSIFTCLPYIYTVVQSPGKLFHITRTKRSHAKVPEVARFASKDDVRQRHVEIAISEECRRSTNINLNRSIYNTRILSKMNQENAKNPFGWKDDEDIVIFLLNRITDFTKFYSKNSWFKHF